MFTFKPKLSARNNKSKQKALQSGSKTPRVSSKKTVKKPTPNIFSAPTSPKSVSGLFSTPTSPKSVANIFEIKLEDCKESELNNSADESKSVETPKVETSEKVEKRQKQKKSWFSRIFNFKKSDKSDKSDFGESVKASKIESNTALNELKSNVKVKSKDSDKKSGFLGFRKRKSSKLKLTIDESVNKVISNDNSPTLESLESKDDSKDSDKSKNSDKSKDSDLSKQILDFQYENFKTVKIKLNTSDINNLYTKSVELLPSPGEGRAILVSSVLFNLAPGTGIFRNVNSPGVININYGSDIKNSSSAIGNCIPKTFYDGISNNSWLLDYYKGFHHVVNYSKDIVDKNISISSLGDPITGGDDSSALYVHITYRVFELV